MSEITLKGDVLGSFVAGLSAIGEKDTVIRLEKMGNALVGNFTANSHASLCDVTLALDGIETDGLEVLVVGVDLVDLQLLPKLVGKDGLASIKFGDGRCHASFGPGKRSFKLLSATEVPLPFTAKPTLTAGWQLPKETVKALVDTLFLAVGTVMTVKKNGDGDTSLKFSTSDYGGLNTAEYLITGDVLRDYVGGPFESMFDFDMFSSVKKLPTESHISFRCDRDYPIEMVGVLGPVTSRIMLAPRIENRE